MIKLGILDFDTSHAEEFTKRFNHKAIAEDQWVEGAEVVIGCPGQSQISPDLVPKYTDGMKKLGVALVDKPEDLIGKVDGMLIEAVDGSVHWERVRPFLEAGIPCFVDKPFACSVADAKKIIDLSEKKKLPLFSSSSLRYAPELVEFQKDKKRQVIGVISYGPCSQHPRNPGLYHYGIHAVEILYTLMGPGCKQVETVTTKEVDMVTGTWADGRVASVRGIRPGGSYGVFVFNEKGAALPVAISTKYIYRELLKQIVEMFKTGKSPLDPLITLEIVAFIEASNKSSVNHGMPETLKL